MPAQGAWGHDPATADTYGKHYNSYAVRDPRGLAPEGWRVATQEDWLELFDELGGLPVAGGKLKVTGTDLWKAPNTDAANSVGFNALPNGYGLLNVVYRGDYASFWSSTTIAADTESTYMYYLYYNNATVEQDWDFGGSGYAVRCIKE
jgi:uncharacterized protein (TIGR02145 family)